MIYKCFNCPYITNDYRNFKRHRTKKNPCTNNKFVCKCQKRFMYVKSLKLHQKKCVVFKNSDKTNEPITNEPKTNGTSSHEPKTNIN